MRRRSLFNQKFIDFYAENHVLTNDKELFKHELKEYIYLYCADFNEYNIIMNNEEKKEKENLDEIILKEKLEKSIYSFYGLYFSEELDTKIFKYKHILENRDFIEPLPLEYFEIKIALNNEISFKFYNDSFKKCFRNIIGFEIEKGTLTSLLKRNDYTHTFLGVCFEKLVTLLLMHNKLNITNLNFEKNNIIEIKVMSHLKEEPYEGQKFDFCNNNKDILIVQKNFFGPMYDLLIITRVMLVIILILFKLVWIRQNNI